jgi:spore germination protein KB
MVLLCVSAAQGGLEILGRTGQIFFPLIVLPLIFILVMLVTDVDFRNIFPVMEHGIMPSIKGAMLPQAWFAEFFMITFILPFLTNGEKAMKWSMLSTLAVMLTLVATNLITLSLYGGNLSRFVYPFMNAARYISKADFFENLESIIIVMWAFGVFVKLSFHLYATSLGFAQWLNLSDYRPIVIPIAYLSVAFSFWDLPNLAVLSRFFVQSGPFYMLLINIAIPVLLLIIAVLRKRIRMTKEDRSG